MPAAPRPPGEACRLAALRRTRLMGTPAEDRFDTITRLARRTFGVPYAVINLVGDKRTWMKSPRLGGSRRPC